MEICGALILVLKNAESITEEILHYFEKLYTNPTGESWGVEGLDWSPISEESALRLESPFTEEEISKAIFQLDRDKAPGPDGFTIAVFQECWDVIKEDLETNIGCVLIANEIVDERRRSGEEGVVFKIDFEKAYDHVKWDFLDHVLEKKGFSPRWRKWMSGCLSSVSFAILVNGSAKGWVKASRGLRQGDPLSPFLFTLVADVLSRMLMRAEERNMLEGFQGGEEELQTLKSLLLVFGHISGLKVNLNKSSIYGINLDQAHLSRLAEMLDCKASGWPILYLGLPLGGNPKSCGFWDPVVERISSRLDGWQKGLLILRGENNSYPVLSYPFAKGWGRQKGSFSEVGYCVQTKDNRGFGLGNISWRNLALLGKWLWRYPREGSALWHQVILSIYGSHSNGWDANTVVRWSHRCPWKAIAQVFQEFSLITRYVVGNGDRIRFWEDLWRGDQPLGTQYPRLFRVVVDKNISISSVLGSISAFLVEFEFPP
ncbi:LINE-1 retrotransposable element ORF2 protein [Vitis vinifera]|uniref:LINE-1 retrotransposable element ORF2 protein n=1 Tax=Vitis vinifera TaxID=29760 RepID=A0A438GAZ2_VITVI|nr:LINE-1 retrotransposable element ORF2 protein [Vitis vinifera]